MSKASARVPFFLVFLSAFVFFTAFAKNGDTAFVFINGGYNETSNYSMHEADLGTFKDNLFKGSRVALFSAGGPKSPVIRMDSKGYFLRDDKGFVLSTPSTIAGTEKATKFNISNYFTKLAENDPPSAVTAIWGDHGNPRGVYLWDGSDMNAKEIRDAYGKLPSTTLVRAVHMHCYGGASMTGTSTDIPLADPQKIQAYLDEKYPANTCGLSLSDSDEVGQYRFDQSKWKKELNDKPVSLASLKGHLDRDSDHYSTVMLTSDYLLRDFKITICTDQKKASAKTEATVCVNCSVTSNTLGTDASKLKSALCEFSKSELEILDDFEKRNMLYEEFDEVEAAVSHEYVKEKHPDFYAKFKAAMDQTNKIKEQISNESDKGKLDNLVKELETVRSDFPTRYRKFVESARSSESFTSFFNKTVNSAWLAKKKDKYPRLERTVRNPENKAYFAQSTMRHYQRASENERDLISKKRGKMIAKKNADRKVMTDLLFADPKLTHLKERYENIRKCEASSLH